MAENIPYKPVPTVQPVETRAPQISETVPHVEISNAVEKALNIVGHGTGILGQAYQEVGESYGKLGRSFAGAGDELFNRAVALQQVELEKGVDKAELALTQKNADLMEQALADPNLGPDGMKAKIKEQMDNREAGAQGLNPWQQEQFRKRTMNMITYDAKRLASHVATTERADTIKTANATIDNIKTRLSDMDPDSPEAKELQKELRNKTINTLAPAQGMHSPEVIQKKLQEDQDEIKYNQIVKTANTDLDSAMRMLKESSDSKNEKVYIADAQKRQALHNELTNKAKNTIPLIASHNAMTDPNVGEKKAGDDAENAGIKRAKEVGLSGDDQIKVGMDSRRTAEGLVREREGVTGFEDGKNANAISKFIMGDNPNKKKIMNEEELPPDMKAQLHGMRDFSQQQQIRNLLKHTPEDVPKTDENRAAYFAYRGALSGNAGNSTRLWAMNKVNFLAMEGMPTEWRQDLTRMQEDEQKKGREAGENTDVRNLFELGKHERLIPTDVWKEDSKEYMQWVGAAGPALEEATKEKQRTLTKEEKKEVIKEITQKQLGLRRDPTAGRALYEMKPPPDEVARIKALRPDATDEEVTRIFQGMVGRNRLKVLEDLKKGAQPEAPAGNVKILKTKPVAP